MSSKELKKELKKEYQRQYRQLHKEYWVNWRNNHPDRLELYKKRFKLRNRLKKDKFEGSGLLKRDDGTLPPAFRKLLSVIGDESITSIKLFRQPISVSKFLNFISNGKYNELLKNNGYDSAFHLGMVINNKFILDKQEVLKFIKGSLPKESQNLSVNVKGGLTINSLIEKTRVYMGNNKFSNYDAEKNNCQDFIQAVLKSNNLSTVDTTSFVKQDAEKIFNNIPRYAKIIIKGVTESAGVVDRIINGEGNLKTTIYK